MGVEGTHTNFRVNQTKNNFSSDDFFFKCICKKLFRILIRFEKNLYPNQPQCILKVESVQISFNNVFFTCLR